MSFDDYRYRTWEWDEPLAPLPVPRFVDGVMRFPLMADCVRHRTVERKQRWQCGPRGGCGHRWERWVPDVGPQLPTHCPECWQEGWGP